MGLLKDSCFSCKKYAERMAQASVQPLTFRERAAFVFHHYFCFYCRRYNTQIVLLESTLEAFAKEFAEKGDRTAAPEALSDDARRRIMERLKLES